jgi:anti-sigma factor RsiW
VSCDPERVTAFVDGELAAGEADSVSAHVEACATCREQAEAERDLRRRLAALPDPALPAALEPRVRTALRPRPARRPWRYALPIAAILVLALAGRTQPAFVAWDLVRDHDKCFSRHPVPAKVWSADEAVVVRWFDEHGTRVPPLPGRVGEYNLVGARYCPLAGLAMAPHVYYDSGSAHVSVFVVPQGARLGRAGRYSAAIRGRAVRLIGVAGVVVGIVGEHEDAVAVFESRLTPEAVARLAVFPRSALLVR